MSAKTIFSIVGVFVGVWAVLGFMDVGNPITCALAAVKSGRAGREAAAA